LYENSQNALVGHMQPLFETPGIINAFRIVQCDPKTITIEKKIS